MYLNVKFFHQKAECVWLPNYNSIGSYPIGHWEWLKHTSVIFINCAGWNRPTTSDADFQNVYFRRLRHLVPCGYSFWSTSVFHLSSEFYPCFGIHSCLVYKRKMSTDWRDVNSWVCEDKRHVYSSNVTFRCRDTQRLLVFAKFLIALEKKKFTQYYQN